MNTLNELTLLGLYRDRCWIDVRESLNRIVGDSVNDCGYWDYISYFRACLALGIPKDLAREVLCAVYVLRLGELDEEDDAHLKKAYEEVEEAAVSLEQFPMVKEFMHV